MQSNGIGNNNTEKNSKNETWKLLINKLRSIQNIDSEIEKLIIHRNELKSEINHLNTKKNEIEEPYIRNLQRTQYRSISWLNYASLQWINALVSTRPTDK